MTSRNTDTIGWDPTNRLTTYTAGASTTTMVYDADGQRLLRKDPTDTWLYLDGLEIQNVGGTLTGYRYYTIAGTTIALLQGTQLQWLAGNDQGHSP